MSRWRVVPAAAQIEERELDYTATFDAHNADTGSVVRITLTQMKGHPCSDLINSLRALAQVLLNAATGRELPPGTERLN